MHIEMTELLRCPAGHREEFMVLATGEMKGRSVWRGAIGCPVCRREYLIKDGVVDFRGEGTREKGEGTATGRPSPLSPLPSPDVLQALLDLSGPGGYVALVGAAVRHAAGLADRIAGVHFVGINAPAGTGETPALSLVLADTRIPLRDVFVRGVVVGSDALGAPWPVEAIRVLLPRRRIVLEGMAADAAAPSGIEKLAAERGVWVGRKS